MRFQRTDRHGFNNAGGVLSPSTLSELMSATRFPGAKGYIRGRLPSRQCAKSTSTVPRNPERHTIPKRPKKKDTHTNRARVAANGFERPLSLPGRVCSYRSQPDGSSARVKRSVVATDGRRTFVALQTSVTPAHRKAASSAAHTKPADLHALTERNGMVRAAPVPRQEKKTEKDEEVDDEDKGPLF